MRLPWVLLTFCVGAPTLGFVVFVSWEMTHDGSFVCAFGEHPLSLLRYWGFTRERLANRANPICMCEASVVLCGIAQFAHLLAGQHVVWFLDNSVSLAAMIKGMSKNSELGFIVAASRLLML